MVGLASLSTLWCCCMSVTQLTPRCLRACSEEPAASSQNTIEQQTASSPVVQLKAKPLCLKHTRPRKQLSVLLPAEFVQEGCAGPRKRSLKRALVWDKEEGSQRDDAFALQPLKRLALGELQARCS